MASTVPTQLTRIGDNELKPWTKGCRLTSGDRLGRPAIYNANTKTYKQNLDIEDSASYCMQPYTITSGPLKGCKAIILVPAGSFRLLDLPREIRNMIYKLLITSDKPIELTTYERRKCVVQTSFKTRSKAGGSGWDGETAKFSLPPTDSMSLLLVNRQVMEEVVEVLYGSNVFSFDNVRALRLFSKTCSNAFSHLRYVTLSFQPYYMQLELKGAQEVLWQAINLRQIHIEHNVICRTGIDAGMMVEIFSPLLRKLQNFKSIQKIVMNVEDVLHLKQCECQWCDDLRNNEGKPSRHGRFYCSCQYKRAQTMPQEVKKIVGERYPPKK